MLNEHCVRLPKGFRLTLPGAMTKLLRLKEWSPVQKLLLEQLHSGLVAARVRRSKLRQFMAGKRSPKNPASFAWRALRD